MDCYPQAPLSMGFSRQEYWSGLPFPSAGDLPDLGIELMSLASPALQAGSLPLASPGNIRLTLKPCISNSRECLLCHFSCLQLLESPCTEARQTPLSMGFSRQEYWSGLPFPSPGDLHDQGIKPRSLAAPALQVDSLLLSQRGSHIHDH